MPEDELAWAHGPSAAQVADLEKAKKSLKSQALHFTAAAAFAQPPPPPPPAEPMTFNSEAERRFFSEPKIQELIGKMKELGDKARLTATTRKEMRLLDKFYSGEGLKQRVKLLFLPEVVNALETIWTAADTDGSGAIDKAEYLVMHRKLVLALDPSTRPIDAFQAGEDDWIKDSAGRTHLDKDRFFWCWFELADLWTDTLEPQHYVDFLRKTMETITRIAPDGVRACRAAAANTAAAQHNSTTLPTIPLTPSLPLLPCIHQQVPYGAGPDPQHRP